MHTNPIEQFVVKCAAVDCQYKKVFLSWKDFLAWQLQWELHHDHGGNFDMEARFPKGRHDLSLRTGDEFVFKTREGRKRNGNDVIAIAPNRMVALFDREAPLTSVLEPNKLVRSVIKEIKSTSIVVTPLEVLGDVPPLDDGMPYRPGEE